MDEREDGDEHEGKAESDSTSEFLPNDCFVQTYLQFMYNIFIFGERKCQKSFLQK